MMRYNSLLHLNNEDHAEWSTLFYKLAPNVKQLSVVQLSWAKMFLHHLDTGELLPF